MSYLINSSYWCNPGSIRIYYPNFVPTDPNDGLRHRFFSYDQVKAQGEENVLNILRRVFSREIEYYNEKQLIRCETCDELRRNALHRSLRQKVQLAHKQADDISGQQELYDQYIEELENQNRRIPDLEKDYQECKEALNEVARQRDYYSAQLQDSQQKDRIAQATLNSIQKYIQYPKDPYQVATYFINTFGDKIAFTKRALDSLQECSTDVSILWDCFFYMATTLRNLYIEGDVDLERRFIDATGYELARGEGKATRKNKALMRLREDVYNGKPIFAEPHVKKGTHDGEATTARVYFAYDADSKQIIVSYCNGRHLDNASTRNAK